MTRCYLPQYVLDEGIDQNSWDSVSSSDAMEYRVNAGKSRAEVYGGMVCLDAVQMFDVALKAPRWDCLELGFYTTLGELVTEDVGIIAEFL